MADGGCYHIPNECPWPVCRLTTSNGTTCDDANICTVTDKCAGGVCVGSPRNCADSFGCTADSCNLTTGCVHVPNNALCLDNFPCTSEVCDVAKGCVITGDNTKCDDSIPCTTNVCDISKGCVYIPVNASCDDKVNCTDNICNLGSGCSYVPNDALCDDKIDCTIDRCDPVLGCLNTVDNSLCDDKIDCTTNTCTKTGCVYSPVDSSCTPANSCATGKCNLSTGCVYATNDTLCNDAIDCTSDVCSAQLGCINDIISGSCPPSSVPALSGPCYQGNCSKTLGACSYSKIPNCLIPTPPPQHQPQPTSASNPGSVTPILDCIQQTSTGYIIFLGYTNTHQDVQVLDIGTNNSISPTPNDRGQPTLFGAGTHSFPFLPI